jgi:hypothetical protein
MSQEQWEQLSGIHTSIALFLNALVEVVHNNRDGRGALKRK